jgi:hypothetical protein
MHWHSGRLLLTFAGVTDRNEAEALRGLLLHVDREENASPEDPEEFYDSTLVGCLVVTREGIDVGTVVEVAHLPAQDLLVVEGAFGEVLVPFVAPIVPEVDVVARRIVIAEPVPDYVIRLILATHPGGEFADPNAAREIAVGASPRAAQAIVTAAKVRALFDGRFHVSIGDVHAVAPAALRHRVIPSFEAEADGLDTDRVVAGIIDRLPRHAPEEAA